MRTLYVVATPIGNLADVTLRSLEVLKSVGWIACEDTRHTKILLDRYNIKTAYVSYHQHSSLQKIDWLLSELKAGKDIALVTDAGTPGISDPGGVLVEKIHVYNKEAHELITIVSVPGPSSLTAALSVCGFAADRFLFLGFLPKKKGRQTLLNALAELDKRLDIQTIAFFESAERIHRTLLDLDGSSSNGKSHIEICLCRELTKKFEEIWRGSLDEAIEKTAVPQKGEFVVVLHRNDKN